MSKVHAALDGIDPIYLRELKDDLGFAEWGRPEDAEALLRDLIKKWHPRLKEILGLPEGRRSPLAGALESGSPIEAAPGINPRSAVLGGGMEKATNLFEPRPEAAAYLEHMHERMNRSTPDYKALYMELLYAVARKWPGETRHQTALRYIQRAESQTGQGCDAKSGSAS